MAHVPFEDLVLVEDADPAALRAAWDRRDAERARAIAAIEAGDYELVDDSDD
jgi:hypothetical protein